MKYRRKIPSRKLYSYLAGSPNGRLDPMGYEGSSLMDCLKDTFEAAAGAFFGLLGPIGTACQIAFDMALGDCAANPPTCAGALWAAAQLCGEAVVAAVGPALAAFANFFEVTFAACMGWKKCFPDKTVGGGGEGNGGGGGGGGAGGGGGHTSFPPVYSGPPIWSGGPSPFPPGPLSC